MKWAVHNQSLHIDHVAIVGVINVTPDSYFDGGKYIDASSIEKRAREIIEQGADIIEIGGESTGPGSKDVSLDEELHRVLSAIDSIRAALPDAWIAVDTYKAEVAQQALQAGANMINDVTAGRADENMFAVIAEAKCPFVLMYAKDETPRTTVSDREYDNVIEHIRNFLEERIALAEQAGIARKNIIVDPGLGHFVSAQAEYSFAILDNLEAFSVIVPVLVSPSRKSFLAGPENLPPSGRLEATLEATKTAIKHGATFIRTHDVAETKKVCDALCE